ncbi:MAG TPA: asparagine synthase-related protein [Bacteroidales bacterium]|nr:asparagine synthase-related protein [Bacteroidales bacterium]
MILGAITFQSSEKSDTVISKIRSFIDLKDIFQPVEQQNFTGGYYLHHNLPCKSDDLIYTDIQNDILVLLSGYIYNNSELAELHEIEDQVSDPELIARLFLEDGPEFVEKLNGDFAFLIYRKRKGESYLFRDHIGIRPLGWTLENQTLFFATEILAFCRAFAKGNIIDSDYLLGALKYIDYKKTPDKDIYKLLPGHYLTYFGKGVEIIRYWQPEKIRIDKKLRYAQMLSDLQSILNDSVKIRCDNRFSAGAHVTGGIDSGIVSAIARKHFHHQERFYGFSWSPAQFTRENVKYDERDLVVKFCEETNIEPLFSTLSTDEFTGLISSFYRNHGFYSEDSISQQEVKTNTNLIFSGWGGDEFLSTGDRGIDMDLLTGFNVRLFFKRNPLKRPVKLFRYLLSFIIFPFFGILDRETGKSFKEDARYLKKPYKHSDKEAIADFYFHKSRRQLHLKMLEFYHLQDRCEHWYIMGFRKGIEYRYPLLDKRIIEYMLKVPSELLCETVQFRPILREIGKGVLPEAVRLNSDKSDPVYWTWMNGLLKSSALMIMKDINILKNNSDLYFVDFEELDKDINKFKTNQLKLDHRILFKALVNIQAIHEFTKEYRSSKS